MKAIFLIWCFCPALLFGFSASRKAEGFFTDSQKALKLAESEGRPLLISFFGIWCPPCNELEETVFEGREFLERAKEFVLLKVDADAKESWPLKDKYQVGGYPTVVFANPKGEEIYRVVGYRSPKAFVKVMDLVLSAKNSSLAESCSSSDPESLWRCGVICSERKDIDCATKAFKTLQPKLESDSTRALMAKEFFVSHSENEDLKKMGFEQLMKAHPKRPHAILWAYSYKNLMDEHSKMKPKKDLVMKVIDHSKEMEASTELDDLGITPSDVIQIRAILQGWLGMPKEAKETWAYAAEKLEQLSNSLPKGSHARGFALEQISCLEQAGKENEALKLGNEYRERFPEEFTFHYLVGSIQFRKNQYAKAVEPLTQAYEKSYGDNRIRSATLLIQVLGTLGDGEQALKVYRSVKDSITPNSDLKIRTHRYLKALEQAWAKTSKT